jgi:tripartite ATP-independent transporter DctP family solute receptor
LKAIASIGMFIIVGLLAAYLVGYQPNWNEQLYQDDEQTGLKQRIVIKFSHVVAENTPKGLAAAEFADLVKRKSKDRVEIQVFPNGMLYGENNEVAALQRGDIQMIAPSFSTMSEIDPAWLVMDLPFAFKDQNEVESKLNGSLGDKLFQTLKPHGMKGVAFWSNGFKQVTNNVRPILGPQDFKGLKFRIQPSPLIERHIKNWGGKTSVIPFNDAYRNLADGSVDGQENTISNIVSKRLYQVQKYMTISNHGYLGYAVIFNKSFWDNLPSDVQQLLMEALDETTEQANKKTARNETHMNEINTNQNLQISILTKEQTSEWRIASKELYKDFALKIGADVMSEISGP